AELEAAIADSNGLPMPAGLSRYVHVPFCASPRLYCACARVITRSAAAGQAVLVDLGSELGLGAPRFDRGRTVRQVPVVGGAPATLLRADRVRQLMALLRPHFQFAPDAELGLEVDPRTVDPAGIRELRNIGFNRISVGVQDLDPQVQKAVNRIHDTAMVSAVIGAARGVGFESISVDLIYGLPMQTTTGFSKTIESIISMGPDRISLFNYAHLPHLFKAQRQIDIEQMPSPATKLG